MDLNSKESFDSDHDQTNQQRENNNFDEILRSEHSSRMDFNKTGGIFVERTLALIKPDAVNKANEIETILLNHGFTVLQVNLFSTSKRKKNNIRILFFLLETTCCFNS